MKEINNNNNKKNPNLCLINNVKGWLEAKKTKGRQICGCHCILSSLHSDNLLLIPHTRGQILFAVAWRTSESRAIDEETGDYFVPCAQTEANTTLIGLTKSDQKGFPKLWTRVVQSIICVSRCHQTRAGKLRDEAC